MFKKECSHEGKRVFAKRVFENGTVHYCVQCTDCKLVVKLPEFNNRPWIRKDEIPQGYVIHDFIEQEF